jgi:hypothetical protein
MSRTIRLIVVYAVGALLLSCVDVVYETFSPLTDSESGESIDWCDLAGLRGGALLVGHREGGSAGGLMMEAHLPQLPPAPFFAGTGPESGGVFVAVWLLLGVAACLHLVLRRARRVSDKRSL